MIGNKLIISVSAVLAWLGSSPATYNTAQPNDEGAKTEGVATLINSVGAERTHFAIYVGKGGCQKEKSEHCVFSIIGTSGVMKEDGRIQHKYLDPLDGKFFKTTASDVVAMRKAQRRWADM